MLTQYVVAFHVTALTHFILAVIIYAKGPRRLTNVTYALYSVAISWWSVFEAVAITRPDAEAALFWWRLNHVGVIFIPVFFVHFVISLLEPHQQSRRRYVIRGIYLFGLTALILNATPILIREVVPKFSFKYFINPGLVYHIFFTLWVSLAIYGLVELFRVYATSARAKRNQLTYFCWSMFVAYLGGIPNFLPTFNIEIPYLMPFGTYAIPLYALATAYAIVRYRLMDINLALTRGAIFLGVYACVISLPFLLAITSKELLETIFGERWWGAPLGLMALLATLGHYVNLFFQQKAEARLLREQRRYQFMLLNAAKGMTQIHDLHRLLKLLSYLLVRAMKLEHAGIFLWDDGREQYVLQVQVRPSCKVSNPPLECGTHEPLVLWLMQERAAVVREEISQLTDTKRGRTVSLSRLETRLKNLDAAVVVPSFVNDRLIGFLALGNKRTDIMYSEDDLSMLQTLANQAALAIENAQFYQQEHERQAELFHAESLADLGSMANSMSHQLNNPLCIIAGTAQSRAEHLRKLLKQHADLPEAVRQGVEQELQSLQSIHEEAIAGSNIIASVRGITASHEQPRPMALAEALTVALPMAQYKVPFNQIDFRQELPEDLPVIWGNRSKLAQCLINLIANAWDAIKHKQEDREIALPADYRGLIRLAASATTEPDPKTKKPTRWVVLTISDNGIGVKPERLRKLFIPYYTTKPTTEQLRGYGLYVISQIIEAHSGTITVDSTYGMGTTFKIRLPALSDDEIERRIAMGSASGNGAAAPGTPG